VPSFFQVTEPIRAAARMGAVEDYAIRYKELVSHGIELVHTPEEYERTLLLPV